jgi:major type 1 subunit fimbrin (pilin)
MKIKNSAFTAGALLLGISSPVMASDGTIAVAGNITDGTCIVLGAAAEGGTPSPAITIRLPQVSTAMDIIAGNTKFHIYLRGCRATASQQNIAVTFTSNNIAFNESQILANTTPGGAGNLGISIMRWTNSCGPNCRSPDAQYLDGRIHANAAIPLTDDPQDLMIEYEARYQELNYDLPVTAGRITASAWYDVRYF